MKKVASIKVVIDRIEGDSPAESGGNAIAVLVLYDDDGVKFNLPVKYLPDGIKEGDHLRLSFKTDKESRETESLKVRDLLRELTGKNDDQNS